MKYIVLVSHGTFAAGLHNALSMLAGGDRTDIISAGLENGMSADEFAGKFKECLSKIAEGDEIILFGDLIGGSPLTTASNVIAKEGLLERTVMFGGMNLPLVLSAALMKDAMEMKDLADMLLAEAREQIKEFLVTTDESEDEI